MVKKSVKVSFRIRKDFEEYLKKFHGWTVSDLEKELGFKKQQVSQTISGKKEPTMNFLHRVCALTNVPAEKFIETVFVK